MIEYEEKLRSLEGHAARMRNLALKWLTVVGKMHILGVACR